MSKKLLLNLFLLIAVFTSAQGKNQKAYEKLIKLPAAELAEKGNHFYENNEIDTALRFYLILIAKYKESQDKSDLYLSAMSYNRSAVIYQQRGNYTESFELLLKGIRICEQNDFQELLSRLYINMGNIYCIFKDYDRGKVSYEKALALASDQQNPELEWKALDNLVGVCCYAGYTPKAKYYYQRMKNLPGGSDRELHQYFNLLNQGLILVNEHKIDSALYCYKASADYAISSQLGPQYKSSSYFELAKLYELKGNKDSALYYLNLNVKLLRENRLMDMLAESLKAMARIYGQSGDRKSEQQYKSEYMTISDSIFSLQKLSKMKNAQFVYEMNQSEEQIQMLNATKAENESKIKVQRRIMFGISAGLMIFLVMCIVVYRQKRKLRTAYKELFSRNHEILDSDRRRRQRELELEDKLAGERLRIKELVGELELLKTTQEGGGDLRSGGDISGIAVADECKEEVRGLYSVDRLTEEQKEKLIKDINLVLEEGAGYCDSDFSLERLSGLVGSNSRYVSQVINDTYNKNFRTFINEYRIREVQRRLLNTAEYGNFTIKAVAESVGYKSQANFITSFKKVTGMSPSIFQKLAKEEF